MIGKRGFLIVFVFCLIGIGLVSASFEVDSLFVKVSTQVGDGLTKSVSISSDSGGEFNLQLVGLNGVKIDESDFSLQSGGIKSVKLDFNSSGVGPGVGVGSLVIGEGSVKKYLPIIFEVKSKDIIFDLSLDIPPQYLQVSHGDRLLPQIKIFDLTFGTATLNNQSATIKYVISNILGNEVYSESENVIVNRDTQITKTIFLPKTIKEGSYVLSAVINYGSSVGVSSKMFDVKKSDLFSNILVDNSKLLIVLGAIVLFFLGMIAFFVYIVKDRDKFIFELKKYNSLEMKRQKELLRAQAEIVKKKKNVSSGVLEKEIDSKIRALRAKQVDRVKQLKTLKSSGNVKEMEKKVREWKNKGYNTLGLEYKLKGLGVGEMKNLMNKWKGKSKN